MYYNTIKISWKQSLFQSKTLLFHKCLFFLSKQYNVINVKFLWKSGKNNKFAHKTICNKIICGNLSNKLSVF